MKTAGGNMTDLVQTLLSEPSSETLTRSGLAKFLEHLEKTQNVSFGTPSEESYRHLHRWSVENLEAFWDSLWDFAGIQGDKGPIILKNPDNMLEASFYPEGKINYTENVFDQCPHQKEQAALIARCQGDEDIAYSWRELAEQVSLWEQALKAQGVGKGDRVCVYLPNIAETVIILLACANMGAIFASAGSEMGADDLISRFNQIEPKVFVAIDGYRHGPKEFSRTEIIEKVQQAIPSLQKTVVIPFLTKKQADLSQLKNFVLVKEFLAEFTAQPLTHQRFDFNHPLYILFSSGSTGKPKCFVHSQGGSLLKHSEEFLLQCDVHAKDRVFYHATPSWMMWNWLVSGLTVGATILLYDGSPAYPTRYTQWDFCDAHNCTHHGTAAPLILSWAGQKLSMKDHYDLESLRMILSTGAVLPEQGFDYLSKHVKENIAICSISGGSDIVGCFVGGNPFGKTYAGQIHGPLLGMDVKILNDTGAEVAVGDSGELVCCRPFPSMPVCFWNDPEKKRYQEEYFSHYPSKTPIWRHGDAIYETEQGQYVIVGRSDATLNQNGVRIGTTAIYDQLDGLPEISEAAAINFTRPSDKQVITVLCLDLKDHPEKIPTTLVAQIRKNIKNNVTPYAIPAEILPVNGILKTPNGKKAELVMSKILNGKEINNPSLYGETLVNEFQKIGQSLVEKYS